VLELHNSLCTNFNFLIFSLLTSPILQHVFQFVFIGLFVSWLWYCMMWWHQTSASPGVVIARQWLYQRYSHLCACVIKLDIGQRMVTW